MMLNRLYDVVVVFLFLKKLEGKKNGFDKEEKSLSLHYAEAIKIKREREGRSECKKPGLIFFMFSQKNEKKKKC